MSRSLFKFYLFWIPLMIIVYSLTDTLWSLVVLFVGYLSGMFHDYLIEKEVRNDLGL